MIYNKQIVSKLSPEEIEVVSGLSWRPYCEGDISWL